MNKYLIDTENVSHYWLGLCEKFKKTDSIYLFYTSNTANISYKDLSVLLSKTKKIYSKECFTGKNSLDFHLVTEMGMMLTNEPKTNFIIVSNDKGYDPLIKSLNDRGYSVKRLPCECKKESSDGTKNEIKVIIKGMDCSTVIRMYHLNQKQLEKLIDESTSITNFHNNLVKTYGNKNGGNIYLHLKPQAKKLLKAS